MNNYPQGIVITKTHPVLKFGQVVFIVEVTPDLYLVKANKNSKPEIVDKKDIRRQ
jgi:hypothetical protein